MNIYIDFDDCICETARYFSGLVKKLYNLDIPYEKIKYFNLQKSFSLTDKEYEDMMIYAHKPEILLSYEESPGAISGIQTLMNKEHNVKIITGRPSASYEASRQWLDEHGLSNAELYCLNKYGRDTFIKGSSFTLELEDYYKMHFDYAIEDSPSAFKFFNHLKDLKVLVYDRPWNQTCDFPNENYQRCSNWQIILNKISSEQ